MDNNDVMELLDELFDERVVNIVEGLLDGEGYCGIVDVLRRESEVDEVLD